MERLLALQILCLPTARTQQLPTAQNCAHKLHPPTSSVT